MPNDLESAHVLRGSGRSREAAAAYERLFQSTSPRDWLMSARLLRWQGNAHFALGESVSARACYRSAIEHLQRGSANEQSLLSAEGLESLAACRFDLGQLEHYAGQHESARRELSAAYEAAPSAALSFECEIALIMVLAGSWVYRDEAEKRLEGLERRIQGAETSRALRIRLLTARGALTQARGDFAEALQHYADIEHLLNAEPNAREAADNATRIAQCHLALDDFDSAEVWSERAEDQLTRVGEHPRFRVSLMVDRAKMALARGDLDGARRLLATAEQTLESLSDSTLELARCRATYGDLLQRMGDLLGAASKHAAAQIEFGQSEWTASEWVTCTIDLACDHLLTKKARYVRRGIVLLESAHDALNRSGGDPLERARCAANLALARLILDQDREAETGFRVAASIYREHRRWLDLTTVNHNLGCLLAARARGSRSPAESSTLRQQALDLLVPATLVRDAVKHELGIAEHRRIWWREQASGSLAAAMAVAHEDRDAALVSELVVGARLSAALVVDRGSPSGLQGHLGPYALMSAASLVDRGSRPSSMDPRRSVRSQPGPRVLMPSGSTERIALERYLELAAEQYGRPTTTLRSNSRISLV